ncbi:hypothetical protein PTTG_25501 [Puccinia triticina 1-1 BBBD Race 1]|uniref:CCHC-type domain-containing protein n=1 Tax=Puccinia triticina (isolate 1-1 / race 1 (BBBD)) TaxID=630390 RepID=A0A180H149_PUCT1|nr:hypothetical protein PTTG_25501 [Puccinia triticina 1-1 BBBD Race 1]
MADFNLEYKEYYFRDYSRHRVDKIARAILLISLSREIKAEVDGFDSSFEIMNAIRRRFTTFSRAAQMNRWDDLESIPCDLSTPATSVAATYQRRFLDFTESGAVLTKDFLFGVLLQSSLGHNTALRQEFDYCVDQELAARRQIPLLFVEMIDILNDCQEKIKGRDAAQQRQIAPTTFSAEAPAQNQRSTSIESHPDNVYTMAGRPANFRSPAPRHCYRCGSGKHLIGACPVPATPSQQPNNTRGQHFPPPQYTAYYLILAPPIPTSGFHQLPAKPAPPTGTNLRPADIYRPVYPKDTRSTSSQRPAAREAEVSTPTEQPSAQNMELDGIDGQPMFSELNFSAVSPSAKGNAHFSWGEFNAYGHQ